MGEKVLRCSFEGVGLGSLGGFGEKGGKCSLGVLMGLAFFGRFLGACWLVVFLSFGFRGGFFSTLKLCWVVEFGVFFDVSFES